MSRYLEPLLDVERDFKSVQYFYTSCIYNAGGTRPGDRMGLCPCFTMSMFQMGIKMLIFRQESAAPFRMHSYKIAKSVQPDISLFVADELPLNSTRHALLS